MEVTRIAVSSCQNKYYLLQMLATEKVAFFELVFNRLLGNYTIWYR